MIVKGHTKSGIKFQIDSKIKDDVRLLFLLTQAQKQQDEDPLKAGKTMMDLLALIFGSDENVLNFMNAVAATHKGVCKTEIMIGEIKEMFEAINAKNS